MVYVINGEHLTRRRLVTIDGSKVTTETDIPLSLNINLPGAKAAGADVRLAKPDGTPLAREIECKDVPNTDDVMIWYQWDTITTQNDQFYVYWGNAALTEPAVDSTYGSQNVWESNYKAVYHLNNDPDGDGACILDSTSNSKHATPSASLATDDLIDGDFGRGINFVKDSNDSISIPATTHSAPSEITAIVKFKSGVSDTTEQRLFVYSTDETFHIISMNSNTADLVRGYHSGSSGGGWTSTTTSYSVTNYHTYIITAKDNDYISFYVDGTLISPATAIGLLTSADPVGNYIGCGRVNNNQFTTGIFDTVMILNTQKSANYISTISNNFFNPTATGTTPFYLSIENEQHQRRTPQFIG